MEEAIFNSIPFFCFVVQWRRSKLSKSSKVSEVSEVSYFVMGFQKPNFLRPAERGPVPEQGPVIKSPVSPERHSDAALSGSPAVPAPTVNLPQTPSPVASRAATVEGRLRQILSEDMTELLTALPADKKLEVQTEGLKTIAQIQELLKQAHLQIRKIFQLIWQWLKRIPGLNRFFL